MFDLLKRWLGALRAAPAPAGAGAEPAAIERCLRAYRTGVEQFKAGDLGLAESHLNEALAHKHDLAEAHFYLGLIHRKRSEPEDAADCLVLAIEFKPDFAEAWLYLGIIAMERRQYDVAARDFAAALRIRPDYAEAYNCLGELSQQREQFRDAATHFRKAVELKPDYALAYSNLANVTLREFFDADSALGYAQKALELDARLAGAHNNLAMILQFQGRSQEALIATKRALALNPGVPETLFIRALAQLTLGQFDGGWRDYEARKQILPTFKVRKFPYREWDGSPLTDRSLLVYYEQGLGDEIMFASCLPDLLAQGGHCVVECSQKLELLFRRSFPAAAVHVANQEVADMTYLKVLPRFDWQVAAGSLPQFFRRKREDFPVHHGYLTADPKQIGYWRARLNKLGPGRKIGLSWRGGRYYTNQSQRSIELAQLLPLLRVPGAQFVSLQYTDCRSEIEQLQDQHGVTVHHWQESIDDYDETAALICALDLTVSVQTAVVHLSGALDRPAWALVPSNPEWRYMAHGERMPWYPSVRIFRQKGGPDWDPVICDVRCELAAWMANPGDRIAV